MRIVGHRSAALLLGLTLACLGAGAVSAQTVVGGDWRPQVEVDPSVLDRLGPEPTLPDLLLGRRPMAPAGAPVKLHRPRATTAALVHAPKVAKSAATAKLAESDTPVEQPPKAIKPGHKAAKAEKPIKIAEASEPTGTKPPASAKKLASSLEPPPPPAAAKALPNADMPAMTPPPVPTSSPAPAPKSTPAPAAAATKEPASTPNPVPAPAPAQAKKLTSAMPLPTAATTPAPTPAPAPAPSASANATPAAPVATPNPPAATSAPETKTAMLTPPPAASAAAAGESAASASIAFPKDGAALTDDGRNALIAAAKRAAADPAIQLQVLAYASGDEENASKARRLSLSRALAVRSFLIDQGVHSTRIEVRALGNKVPEGPADRVDLVEQKH